MENNSKHHETPSSDRSELKEKIVIVVEWIKAHKKEIAMGTLTVLFFAATGECIRLNKQNSSLVYLIGQLDGEIDFLTIANEELKNELYSLAGDATRCGSSVGGQILSAARYNKVSLYS